MITSAQNSLLKEIRKLRKSKRAREGAGLFLVEGIQGVVEAVQSGAPLQALVYAPDLLTSEIAAWAIARAEERGVRCEAVAAHLFDSLSDRDNPVGILALVERRLLALEELQPGPGSLYVALSEIGDPGNLGTVLRTIDAAGGDGLLLVGQTVDPFHPTAARASAGTIFSVPMVALPELESLLAWCERAGVTLVATSDRAEAEYWAMDYPSPLLLLMGAEAHGLPEALLARLGNVVRIPMAGVVDSLNLGVATALLLYEVRRQWRA